MVGVDGRQMGWSMDDNRRGGGSEQVGGRPCRLWDHGQAVNGKAVVSGGGGGTVAGDGSFRQRQQEWRAVGGWRR